MMEKLYSGISLLQLSEEEKKAVSRGNLEHLMETAIRYNNFQLARKCINLEFKPTRGNLVTAITQNQGTKMVNFLIPYASDEKFAYTVAIRLGLNDLVTPILYKFSFEDRKTFLDEAWRSENWEIIDQISQEQ